MKYLSVCSGIEAATVAWHGLGWEPVSFAEIEAFPAAVLAHHYPTVPNLGDLTKYREWPEELLAEVDLLVGGTPCQAFSVAGLRRSLDDERGNLSLTYVNLFHHINEVRKRHGRSPAIALWENVPGCLSTKDNAFGCILGGLLGCDEAPETESGKWDKAGFLSSETVRVGYRVLDAQYFGVAQRRRRVFLAAVPCELVERFGERACPSEILSLRESVLGNPPTRGASWEGVARATAAGTASGGRGVERCGESQGQDDVVIDAPPVCGTLSDGAHMGGGLTGRTHTLAESYPCVANPLTARMHKGINTTADEGQTPIVTQGGVFDDPVVFPINSDADRQNSAALTPSPDAEGRIRLRDPGIGIGEAGDPMFTMQATKPHAVAVRTANTGANGHGVAEELTHTIDQVQGQAVAFTKAKRAQSNEDDESWVPGEVAPTQNQFDQGDTRATTVVAYNIHTSLATNGASETEWHTALRSRTPGQSENSTTTVVAFTQNSRDEVRQINGDGSVAGALNADAGMHQTNYLAYGVTTEQTPKFSEEKALTITRQSPTGGGQPQCVAFAARAETQQTPSGGALAFQASRNTPMVCAIQERAICENPDAGPDGAGVRDDGVSYTLEARTVTQAVAFANRTRDGIKVPEVMKDGVVPALTNPGNGGRADAVNIAAAMQVRRLCPSECEALQGFPIGYTDVIYRKKPAADGPRYRALGNSMAVPCMWWLGKRIHEATKCD